MLNKVQQKWRNSPTVKILSVLIITLLLLIPAIKIENLIAERQQNKEDVVEEIGSKWGGRQTFTGPILTIPYLELENKGTVNEKLIRKYLHVLPESLTMEGELKPQTKKRSIYKAVLYESDLKYSGRFDLQNFLPKEIDTSKVEWSAATLSFGITDPKGITGISPILCNGANLNIETGLPRSVHMENGVHAQVENLENLTNLDFKGSFSFKGHSDYYMVPIGKTTEIQYTSTWPDPSFTGAFLPNSHEITTSGFTANWKILDFNRSFAQVWDNYFPVLDEFKFGVELMETVDIYQKTYRSIKYAFLIIALTFTFFFFFEILRKLRIHPIQYTIVGFAMLVFYLMLIALSEHIDFGLAFLLSAFGVVGIVSYYFYFISRSLKITAVFGALFGFIYAFIYIILNAEAYALLIGSIGLFVLIGLIMHFTRNVDWYETSGREVAAS